MSDWRKDPKVLEAFQALEGLTIEFGMDCCDLAGVKRWNAAKFALCEAVAAASGSPPSPDEKYLRAEAVIQDAVQGLEFAEDAATVVLPALRCEQVNGEQMVAYVDGATLEALLCKSLEAK